MTKERRYNEDEVAEIFRTAAAPAAPGARATPSESGLTLAELQAVGAEIDIPAERVAASAASLDYRSSPVPPRTSFGMPLSTGLVVELPRAPGEREWALIVTELRQVFGAHGREQSSADVRRWSNGRLHAVVEPTPNGCRLRLGTEKSGAGTLNKLGVTASILAVAMAGGMLTDGGLVAGLASPLTLAVFGIGALAFNAVRLPAWVRQRRSQMDYVAERVRTIVAPASDPDR